MLTCVYLAVVLRFLCPSSAEISAMLGAALKKVRCAAMTEHVRVHVPLEAGELRSCPEYELSSAHGEPFAAGGSEKSARPDPSTRRHASILRADREPARHSGRRDRRRPSR